MGDTLKGIPEFFEATLGEAIALRTDGIATIRELGPPDLCHITKTHTKPETSPIGSYHHVSGVDASTMANLAVYINSLINSQDVNQRWFGSSSTGPWRVSAGVYCCFNAFSKLDTRVKVSIPGNVACMAVNAMGQEQEMNQDLWLETYVSSILRTILYSDSPDYRLRGFRRFDPIPDINAEIKFLDALVTLYPLAAHTGTSSDVQV
ncbi:Chs5p-Arf1p-binding proteins-domain-containing protein, partial [Piptocephalis cylindrospora]